MIFSIDRPIKGSYTEWMIYHETNNFSHFTDKTKSESNKLMWINVELNRLEKGWIDDEGVGHRTHKELVDLIEVNTLEELSDLTRDNSGKIVFGSFKEYEGVDGWIEIYDDYRE